MGLAFKGSNVQFAYSGFNAFRRLLAAEIGIDLDKMEGFDGTRSWSKITDPIVPLLNHSDCEGKIPARQCATIAPRLRELVADWDDSFYRAAALELAEDMERLGVDKLPLIFR